MRVVNTSVRFNGWDWVIEGSDIRSLANAHLIEGYTGSARRFKRLVEIAGMDEDDLYALLHRNGLTEYGARCALEGFGLSTAQGRK